MRIDDQELGVIYRKYSDDELANLAADSATLTDSGRAALRAEIQRRGISDAQLQKLHTKELRREARFDQAEAIRRRKTLLYILTKNDPKGWIWAVLFVLGIVVFEWLRSQLR